MRKTLTSIAAITCISGTTAFAGGLAEPMMEPEVIEESSASSGGFIVPLVLLAVIVAVASSSSNTPAFVED